ncbi:MAG: hypothetical protein ACJ75J_01265, partial [Cytophagaceae bacterium]
TTFLFNSPDYLRKKLNFISFKSRKFSNSENALFYYSISVESGKPMVLYQSAPHMSVKGKVIWENKGVPYFWLHRNQSLLLSVYDEAGNVLFQKSFTAGKTFGEEYKVKKGFSTILKITSE